MTKDIFKLEDKSNVKLCFGIYPYPLLLSSSLDEAEGCKWGIVSGRIRFYQQLLNDAAPKLVRRIPKYGKREIYIVIVKVCL